MKELYIKEGFMLRNVAGNYIVVAVGKASKTFNGMVNLNESGAFLWKTMATKHTIEDLTCAMLDEYDVTEIQAKQDIENFVKVLEENGILK